MTMSEIFPAYDFDSVRTLPALHQVIDGVADKLAADGFADDAAWLRAKPRISLMPEPEERNAILLAIGFRLRRCGYTLCP